MRRQKPYSFYHDRTRTIIDATYENWQLTRTDEREGIHTLINRAVVAVSDLNAESKYIETKFIPDKMDIDEPWLLYKVSQNPGSLFLTSGDLSTSVLTNIPASSSLDGFFDGYFNTCVEISCSTILSGEASSVSSIRSSLEHYNDEIIIHKDNTYRTLYFDSADISDSSIISTIPSGSIEFYTDKNNRVIVLDISSVGEYTLVDTYGRAVEHQLVTQDNNKGHYDPAIDIDSNGVICQFEHDSFMKNYGSKMTDFTPSEWDEVSWGDVNKNDKIDETDLKSINAITPSLRQDINCAVCVTDKYVGKITLQYKISQPTPRYMYRLSSGYKYTTDDSLYSKYGDIVAYDDELATYYVLDRSANTLNAVSADGGVKTLIYVPGWDRLSQLVDIDFVDPFLYVLTYTAGVCRLYFNESKSECPNYISNYIEFKYELRYGKPLKFSISKDNTFLVLYENIIVKYKFKRYTHFSTDEPVATFFHEKVRVYDGTGTYIEPERHYVFNSFDSFAFSLGISRPYGADNTALREIIYDFFKYQQGLDKAGISYGIMRELGYCNKVFNSGSETFLLPGYIASGSLLYIDESEVTIDGTYPKSIPDVCVIGTRNITFTRDYLLAKSAQTIVLSGEFKDEIGNVNTLGVKYDIPEYATTELVEVHSYRDRDFLINIGYIVSGAPTDKFIDFINDLETTSAFTYQSCIPDVSVFGNERIPTIPTLPTIFDTIVESSGSLEVTLE